MSKWTENEVQYLRENYKKMTNEELSIKLNKTENHIRSKKSKLKLSGGKRKLVDYAVYKGDEFLCWGTAGHCAEQLGVGVETIRRYATKTYIEKVEKKNPEHGIVAIKIEG